MDIKTPAWLKAMQNGVIGEARTKSFLLDRFWILERSVDIQGADFLIQRRITSKNILDREPPRFGVVQVKFYESQNTTHHIFKEYVLDESGIPREEFFLLCHTGYEDNPKIYFMTAKMISQDLKMVEKNDTMQYRLYGSDIIGTDKYLVKSNKNTLDRIENQLGLADFTKNRKYISWQLPSSSFDINSILPDFKEPLDNWWGDISAGFKKMKELASSAMFDIMDVYIKLKEITEEVDPIKALGIVEKLSIDYRDGSGRLNIPLPEDLYDGDFETVCYQHIKIVNKLRVDGLLDDFFALNGFIKVSCSDFLANNIPINEDIVHSMKIHFSKDKLQIININHALNSAEKYWSVPLTLDNYGFLNVPESDGIKFISSEEFEYFWLPGRIRIEERYKENLKEYYQNDEYRIICYECMQWIFNEKYHINE